MPKVQAAVGPLGLLASAKADRGTLDKLKEIESEPLDFIGPLLRRLHPNEYDKYDIPLVVRELKRFLALSLLVKNPEFPFVPSLKVDLAWHTFILTTRAYRTFCQNIFGVLSLPPSFDRYRAKLRCPSTVVDTVYLRTS